MTITEALDKGVKRVRKPEWAKSESLELPPMLPNGRHGPWFTLRGIVFDASGSLIEKETPLLFFQADDKASDWEECNSETRP